MSTQTTNSFDSSSHIILSLFMPDPHSLTHTTPSLTSPSLQTRPPSSYSSSQILTLKPPNPSPATVSTSRDIRHRPSAFKAQSSTRLFSAKEGPNCHRCALGVWMPRPCMRFSCVCKYREKFIGCPGLCSICKRNVRYVIFSCSVFFLLSLCFALNPRNISKTSRFH